MTTPHIKRSNERTSSFHLGVVSHLAYQTELGASLYRTALQARPHAVRDIGAVRDAVLCLEGSILAAVNDHVDSRLVYDGQFRFAVLLGVRHHNLNEYKQRTSHSSATFERIVVLQSNVR